MLSTGALAAFWLASRPLVFADLVLTASSAALVPTATAVTALVATALLLSGATVTALLLSGATVTALLLSAATVTALMLAATALLLSGATVTALMLAATALLLSGTTVTAFVLAATALVLAPAPLTAFRLASCSRLASFALSSFPLDLILISTEAVSGVSAGLALATLLRPGWSRLDLGLALVAAITAGPRTRDVHVILRFSHHSGRLLGHRHGHRRLGHLLAALRGTELLEDLVHELVLFQFLVPRQPNLLGQVEQLGAGFAPKLGAGESIHCTPLLG
ncbi:MAG: hypothetical protein AMXMBFR33_05390 [Candidatus Xenobia bacterium]